MQNVFLTVHFLIYLLFCASAGCYLLTVTFSLDEHWKNYTPILLFQY